MAGTLLDGQLIAPIVRHGVRYEVATPSHEAAIRRLLRDAPMRGAIALGFEREPDYFRGGSLGGATDHTIVAFENERLVCMGRSTVRWAWLNGERRRVGYLGELRLAACASGRFAILRDGYRFFHELHHHDPADFIFTSIASDNHRARQLLERGMRGLPRYTFLTEFVTLVMPVARLLRSAATEPSAATLPEIAAFLHGEGSRYQLATAWDEESLASLAKHELSPADFVALRHGGKLCAAGALWDQRPFRQTVIRGYAPALGALRPVANLVATFWGGPRLPAPGTVLPHAFVSPFAIAPGCEGELPQLIAQLAKRAAARGIELLTFGFAANDPMLAMVERLGPARRYVSRLYQTDWPDEAAREKPNPGLFRPEIALL